MQKQTKNCVRCLVNKAKNWAGHVRDGEKQVIAGWCTNCYSKKIGFSGLYKKKMGKAEWIG